MKLSKLDISKYLQDLRKESGKTLREVAAYLEIDQAILSKMENGKRPVTKDVLTQLAKLYKKDIQELHKVFLAEKLYKQLENEDDAMSILKLLEKQVVYKTKHDSEKEHIKKTVQAYFAELDVVQEVSLFGSFVRKEETGKSDIDLLIQFVAKKKISMFDILKMQHDLEELLNRKVDLIEEGQLKPSAAVEVVREKEVVYVKAKRQAKG
jgi:predicted nucleotidyltransferase/plasmid maintenance system antidote protein VapI